MYSPVAGTVYFIGAGPGAPDLITVRGRDSIAQADLVLYADSLVQQSVAHLAQKEGARIVGSADLHLEQMIDLMTEVARAGGVVARVHTGDPALYGAIHEQMVCLDERGIAYEVVPGVTAAFAAAARLGVELTLPEVVQTVILSRIAGRTPVPEGEALHGLAAHGATLVLYLSITRMRGVVDELLAGGAYTPQTPIAVVHRVTWEDESMVTGTLADIADKVKAAGYTKHALILVGPALDPALRQPERAIRSRLYDRSFAHGYRASAPAAPADNADHQQPSTPPPHEVAVIAVTRQGSQQAARLAHALQAALVVPERFAAQAAELAADTTAPTPYSGPVRDEIRRRWAQHRALVLVLAAGVAVRAVAPLLQHKAHDPAVVCLDEAGHSVIPLLGGHRAGANELARRIATLTGGHAAITTASDVQHLPALDLLGSDAGWKIATSSALTHASACLVNGDPLGVFIDPALPEVQQQARAWLQAAPDIDYVEQLGQLADDTYRAGLIISHRLLNRRQRHLLDKCVLYHPPVLVAGVGSRQGVPAAEIRDALETTLSDAGLALASVAALATAEMKADEPGLLQAAQSLGVPLRVIERAHLEALTAEGYSTSAAQRAFGIPGVAEPCAVLVAGGDRDSLLVRKHIFAGCTVAVALLRQAAHTEGNSLCP